MKAFHVLLSALAVVALAFPQAEARVVVQGDTNPGNRNVVRPGQYLPGGNLPVTRSPWQHQRHVQPPPPPRPREMRPPRPPQPPPPPRPKVKGPERYTPEGYLKPSTKAPHRVQDGPLQPRR